MGGYRMSYLFIVEDRIKGVHSSLTMVKKWVIEHEKKFKTNCVIAKEIEAV